MKVGVIVAAPTATAVVDQIIAAEAAGLDAVWMTSGGVAPDPLAIYAAAAMRTSRVALGTAIVQTFPRHPLALVQSAQVIDQLAPGRLVLGVGPSGPLVVERVFGIPFERPQQHLREYVTILRSALGEGRVSFQGQRIVAEAQLPAATGVRVMAAALRASAFRLCGELADGAISWLCPPAYLRAVAIPALAAGAERAGRPRPALVAHVPVALSGDTEAVREAFRKQFGFFARVAAYQEMFADAGYAEPKEQQRFSDALVDALVVSGSGDEIAARFRELAEAGFEEVMVSLLQTPGGPASAEAYRQLATFASA